MLFPKQRRSTPYTMSKHGVLGLTRTLGAEWATRGVGHVDPQLACFALGHERENSTCAVRPLTLPLLRNGPLPLPLSAGEGLSAIGAPTNIREDV